MLLESKKNMRVTTHFTLNLMMTNVLCLLLCFGYFRKSGYDRGHLAAAANHRSSQDSLCATFFLSNMSPQVGEILGTFRFQYKYKTEYEYDFSALLITSVSVLFNCILCLTLGRYFFYFPKK